MAYIKPQEVLSPKDKISELNIIVDGGEYGLSIAKAKWEEDDKYLIRWNGGDDSQLGMPQARGFATWFVLPDYMGDIIESIRYSNPVDIQRAILNFKGIIG